jgi:hypothetical protein
VRADGADHGLLQCREELDELLRAWLVEVAVNG